MLNHLKLGYTAIDIGAHKGAYTYWMSKYVGNEGRVFSFEPQPDLHNQLVSLIKHSNNKNINLEASALSSAKGKDTLKIPGGGTSPSASLINKKSQNISETILIKKTTLDDYFYKKNQIPVNFIKCDVEGHEADVFYGAKKTLIKYMPILLFECHRSEEEKGDLFNYLVDLGYTGYFFHVTQKDHANIFRRGIGEYIHFSKHREYEYCRPGVEHRNYYFMKKGDHP